MPGFPNRAEHKLAACGLCLHVGFVGAGATAVGLLQLFDGEPNLRAVSLAIAGCLLATAGWRHARTVLEDAEAMPGPGGNAAIDTKAR